MQSHTSAEDSWLGIKYKKLGISATAAGTFLFRFTQYKKVFRYPRRTQAVACSGAHAKQKTPIWCFLFCMCSR
jgi:hypothetical protein